MKGAICDMKIKQDYSDSLLAFSTYLVVTPSDVRPGIPLNISINILQYHGDVNVKADLVERSTKNQIATAHGIFSQSWCFEYTNIFNINPLAFFSNLLYLRTIYTDELPRLIDYHLLYYKWQTKKVYHEFTKSEHIA